MMKRDLIIAVLATFCLTATLFLILPVRSTGTYDPWADFNGKGKINMLDVGYVASLFGTKGDPTRNVTVTNWPTSSDTSVWWSQTISTGLISPLYSAAGFGYLHILIQSFSLGSAVIRVGVYGQLYNATHTIGESTLTYQVDLTSTSSYAAITISVPSQYFFFYTYIFSGSAPTANIYLSFYLTWS
jgi:hypothetical protein